MPRSGSPGAMRGGARRQPRRRPSAGLSCHIFSPRETQDYYHAIEWAGTRPWSNGKVGLNGISYYAINQWAVAAPCSRRISAAMVPWEGAANVYRDWSRHRRHPVQRVHGGLVSPPGPGGTARQFRRAS